MSVAVGPREGAVDHPAAGQQHEALGGIRTLGLISTVHVPRGESAGIATIGEGGAMITHFIRRVACWRAHRADTSTFAPIETRVTEIVQLIFGQPLEQS